MKRAQTNVVAWAVMGIGLMAHTSWLRADDDSPPPATTNITGQAGVNTALSAADHAASIQKLVGIASSVTCPAGLPVPTRTSIAACDISRVTRPNIAAPAGVIPACDGIRDRDYQQLLFLNTQVYRLMSDHSEEMAARMSCMLGIPLTPAHIKDALADMSAMLCQTGPDANRDFIVSCGREENASAYFEGGSPYASGSVNRFAGSLNFRTDKLDSLKQIEERNGGSPDSLRARRQARQDFMDTLIHENVHALTSYLSKRYHAQGAGSDGAHSTCSVGALTRKYAPRCGPSWDLAGGAANRFEYGLGSNSYDASTYAPYPTTEYIAKQTQADRAWIDKHRAKMASLLKKREKGSPLTSTQEDQLNEWDTLNERVKDLAERLPCAQAYEAAGSNAILQDWDGQKWSDPKQTCHSRPSVRFRDEANARFIARMLAGSNCEKADRYFFKDYGGVRAE